MSALPDDRCSASRGRPCWSRSTCRRHHLLDPDLPKGRFLNRELSWLDFNARVLELAEDPTTPLLERAKFLAIFATNLDEFFMVRVAGLKRRAAARLQYNSPDGLSTREQLERISARTAELVERHASCWRDAVGPQLAKAGIRIAALERSRPPPARAARHVLLASRSSRCSPRWPWTRPTRSRTSAAFR